MDDNFEYGLDQSKSLYIRKKHYVAWELLRDTRNIELIYNDTFEIKIGKSKQGKFYKIVNDGPWTSFVKKENAPVIFGMGNIIATQANHYWVQYGKETIVKETVITNKKKDEERIEGYFDFVAADISSKNNLYQKLVFDSTTLDKAVEILMHKKK